MATIEQMVARLEALAGVGDHAGCAAVRAQICAAYPEDKQAVEAHYKLGLDLLFRRRELAAAAEAFAQAAQAGDPYWSAAARISLGLCWARMGRLQQGLLELRRVGFVDDASVHSVTALSFLQVLAAEGADAKEPQRIEAERFRQLQRLLRSAEAAGSLGDLGFALYHLALIHHQRSETDAASALLMRARDLGEAAVGEALFADIAALL